MYAIPQKIEAITHPLINSMYLKHAPQEEVLVIETNFSQELGDHELYDAYLEELLFDLGNLKMLAEEKVGKVDRIDIRAAQKIH